MSLEELILSHAAGLDIPTFERQGDAVGVMMIPIPRSGMFRGCSGLDEARQLPNIVGIEISAKLNYPIVPLPEGSSYLGFIFAKGDSPAQVELALRDAHQQIEFRIERMISMSAR